MSQNFMSFDEGGAMAADSVGIVDEGGNYPGTIQIAIVKKSTQSNAAWVEFNATTPAGGLNYLNVFFKKKDGTADNRKNHLNSLMGHLGLQSITYEKTTWNGQEVWHIPEFQNKQVMFGVEREDQGGKDSQGRQKFSINLLHFYDVNTQQTYSEKMTNSDPLTIRMPIQDKLIGGNGGAGFGGDFGGGFGSDQSQGGAPHDQNAPIDDDLPF